MSQKNKKKKSQSDSTNKKRILLKLGANEAFSPDTARTFKDLDLGNFKKFEKHIILLESEGIIKTEGKGDTMKMWANKDKIKPKKRSNNLSFMTLWFVSSFVLIFLFIIYFNH